MCDSLHGTLSAKVSGSVLDNRRWRIVLGHAQILISAAVKHAVLKVLRVWLNSLDGRQNATVPLRDRANA